MVMNRNKTIVSVIIIFFLIGFSVGVFSTNFNNKEKMVSIEKVIVNSQNIGNKDLAIESGKSISIEVHTKMNTEADDKLSLELYGMKTVYDEFLFRKIQEIYIRGKQVEKTVFSIDNFCAPCNGVSYGGNRFYIKLLMEDRLMDKEKIKFDLVESE